MLLVYAAIAFAVFNVRPWHAKSKPVRRPAQVELVAARELVVEAAPSAPALVAKPIAAAAPRAPALAPPDFRAALAQELETLPICRRGGGPEGPGVAEVTYRPDGTAAVSLSRNYAGSTVGACVARRFAHAARSFEGEPVTVRARFEI